MAYKANEKAVVQRYLGAFQTDTLLEFAQLHRADGKAHSNDSSMALSLGGHMFMLNLTAAIVFEQAAKGLDAQAIAAAMADVFDADEQVLLGDVQETIDQLVERGFLIAE